MTSNISAFDFDFPQELIDKYGITDGGLKTLSILINPDIRISEDCLTLNVWTKPQTGQRRKAVMVFVYGGSFVSGSSAVPVYNGQFFADEEDIVLVTIKSVLTHTPFGVQSSSCCQRRLTNSSYRLTFFGFPGNPLGEQNLGLLDQRMAVEWVRDNIGSFGGDPTRITLFGESAGGASTDDYSYAWPDDPIVHGLIPMSGTTRGIGVRNKDSATEFWFKASSALGCGDSNTPAQEVYECMMDAPAETIISSLINTLESPLGLPYSPTIDNKIVFGSDSNRSAARIPMVIGNTDNEAGLFRVFLLQPDSDEFWHYQTQMTFNCPVAARSLASVRDGNPTWRYRWFGVFPNTVFATRPPSGAYHGSELAVLFGNVDESIAPRTREENDIGQYMRGAFAAFAKDPVKGLLEYGSGWPLYVPDEETLIRIGYKNRTGANLALGTLYDEGC